MFVIIVANFNLASKLTSDILKKKSLNFTLPLFTITINVQARFLSVSKKAA